MAGGQAPERPTPVGSIEWRRSRRGWSISRRSSKGFRMPSIARRSSKASTSESCVSEQPPTSWRVTSAKTLAGEDFDGVLAWLGSFLSSWFEEYAQRRAASRPSTRKGAPCPSSRTPPKRRPPPSSGPRSPRRSRTALWRAAASRLRWSKVARRRQSMRPPTTGARVATASRTGSRAVDPLCTRSCTGSSSQTRSKWRASSRRGGRRQRRRHFGRDGVPARSRPGSVAIFGRCPVLGSSCDLRAGQHEVGGFSNARGLCDSLAHGCERP
jgi:hypothetical protein